MGNWSGPVGNTINTLRTSQWQLLSLARWASIACSGSLAGSCLWKDHECPSAKGRCVLLTAMAGVCSFHAQDPEEMLLLLQHASSLGLWVGGGHPGSLGFLIGIL